MELTVSEPSPHRSAQPKITVLIAAYNAETFIHRAVESALAQDLPPFEVLIVDDKSTDDTVGTVRRLASGDPRIRLVELPVNRGPSGARNAGIDQARGDWVAILDADDTIRPNHFSLLWATAQLLEADLVAANFVFFDILTGTDLGLGLKSGPSPELVSVQRYLSQCTDMGDEADWGLLQPMIRLELLTDTGIRYPEKTRHGEDFLFVLEILLSGGRYGLHREPTYLYTTRASGMSRTVLNYENMVDDTLDLLKDPRLGGDPVLRSLIERRGEAVRNLALRRKVTALITARRYRLLMLLMLRAPGAASDVMRRIWRRIAS
jgi:succinoglycan biosynthesis protein ExoO